MKSVKKKINLSEPMKSLDGSNMFEENHSCGFILSYYLTNISSNDPKTTMRIAKELMKDEEIELTIEEVEFLKSIIIEGKMKDIMKFRIVSLLE